MINTVIFDIGNVLMKFDFFSIMEKVFPDRKIVDVVADAYFVSGNWNKLDLGIAGDEEFLASVIAYAPDYEKELRLAFDHVHETLIKEDFAIPWVRGLKERGYRVLFLSNYSTTIMEKGPEVLGFLPLMDGGVFSCDVHLCKPDPAIYKALKEKYRLDFSECVFLDDTLPNLEEANRQGLRTIHVKNHGQAEADLERLLQEEGIEAK
ncbi:MAG: HAD family phosphatase [Lachnospiraceae bacterium]|nr:HAD family phosphatase [Lachnospiraceae bacterium]